MAVNLTRTVAAVISDNTRVDKAPMRDLLNEIIAAINGLDPLLTPSYVNRAAAEAGTPMLAASINMVIVREGNALLLRSRTAFADDPLFSTGARWGVVQRHDSAAILSELRNGRIWTLGSATPSGTTPQPGTNQVLCVTSTGAALYRPIAAPVPPTETGTDRLDAAGQWWRLVWDSQASAADVTALRNALAVSGPIPLSNLRGTANAIVADIAPAYVSAGITTVSDGGELVWVPAAANTADNPTIAIAGDIAREIRRIDGSTFPAAGLVIGQPLVMRRTGGQYRVVRGDVTYAQLAAETAARVAAIVSLTHQQITITSGSTLTDRNAALWTAPNRLRRFTDAVIADAPVALAAPHTGTAETLPAAGGSRTIWRDVGGRIFSRTWDGAAHGAWAEQPNQGAFLSATSALTATDAAQQADINALKVETAPQALGRGDNAVIVTIGGVPTMTQNPQGETRLRLDRETLDWLADEMPGGGGGGSASPGSPDLLGGTDGWSVWQDETGLLTFTAVLDPYEYPREYVALPNGEPFINGASRVPLRMVYGDGLGLAPASMAPARRSDRHAGRSGRPGRA